MKKILFLLLILIISKNIYANDFSFGYTESNGDKVIQIKNNIKFSYLGVDINPKMLFYSASAGNMANFTINAEKDFNEKYDMFFTFDYLDDEKLKISSQFDFMIGGGVYLKKNSFEKHKISLALIYRSNTNQMLNNLRYKFKQTGKYIEYNAIIGVINPTYEVYGNFNVLLKIYKALGLTFDYRFKSKDGINSYIAIAGIKLSY